MALIKKNYFPTKSVPHHRYDSHFFFQFNFWETCATQIFFLFKFQLRDFFSFIHLRVVRSWMNIIEFYYYHTLRRFFSSSSSSACLLVKLFWLRKTFIAEDGRRKVGDKYQLFWCLEVKNFCVGVLGTQNFQYSCLKLVLEFWTLFLALNTKNTEKSRTD